MRFSNPLSEAPTVLSRRTLLKLAGLTTGGLLVAACTRSAPAPFEEQPTPSGQEPASKPINESDAPAPAGDAAAEQAPAPADGPRRGGRLRWGTAREPDGFLDPALGTGQPLTFANWIYEPLVNIDETFGELVPRLAIDWRAEEGGSVWEFDLRQGVRFHHGREFVADDVVHTFERILDPDFGSPGRPVLSNIAEVSAVDEHTVRFQLVAANTDFPVSLTGFQPKIVPYDLTDDEVNNEPRGTGPFQIERYANADRIVFGRNPDYWDAERPYLDEVEVIAIPEATTLVNTLQAGDIDAVDAVPEPLMSLIEGNPDLSLLFGPPIQKEYIFMRLDVEPFTDERVRRAFKLIPDRQAMAELSWAGIPHHVSDDNPVIPTNPLHLETDVWQQDLEEARRLLAEAGYGDGLEIDLWAMNDQYAVMEFCLAYADWARQAGVTVNVQGVPSDRYYAEKWLEVSFGTVGWSPRTTADEQLRIAYTSDAQWNETRYHDADFDAMLDQALAEPDTERRQALYAELQRKLIAEGGQIIHAHHPVACAVRQNVHGYQYHPLDSVDLRPVWLS